MGNLRAAGGDEVHRTEDGIPGEIKHGPELAVEYAKGACVTPQHVGVASQGHERSHSVPLRQRRLSEEPSEGMCRRQCAGAAEVARDGAE